MTALRSVLGAALGLGLAAAVAFQPCLALAQAASAAQAPAVRPIQGDGPALWVVRDADSTIYLFGTVHLLRPETAWRTARVQQAFDSASEVWLEFPNPDDPTGLIPVIQQHGLSPQRPLSGLLEAEEFARLVAAGATIGVPEVQLNLSRPWFAALTLTVAAVNKAGYDPQSGVELVVKRMAEAAGKPVKGFETADQQIRLLAGLSEADQLAFLRGTLEQFDQAGADMDRMVDAWAAGDVATLRPLVVDEMRGQSEALYQTLLARRNADWAEQIDTMLDGSGTAFVAVGAGHLLGPDSVQTLLERRGVQVDKVE